VRDEALYHEAAREGIEGEDGRDAPHEGARGGGARGAPADGGRPLGREERVGGDLQEPAQEKDREERARSGARPGHRRRAHTSRGVAGEVVEGQRRGQALAAGGPRHDDWLEGEGGPS